MTFIKLMVRRAHNRGKVCTKLTIYLNGELFTEWEVAVGLSCGMMCVLNLLH
jgi:hypothetical protein